MQACKRGFGNLQLVLKLLVTWAGGYSIPQVHQNIAFPKVKAPGFRVTLSGDRLMALCAEFSDTVMIRSFSICSKFIILLSNKKAAVPETSEAESNFVVLIRRSPRRFV